MKSGFSALALALVSAALSTPAAHSETRIEREFKRVGKVIEIYVGQPLTDVFCNDAMCSGYIENEQVQFMWPQNGWVSLTYFPYTDTFETQAALCGAVMEYATGLGPNGSGTLAGQLMRQASTGRAKTSASGAELSVVLTSSGKPECTAKRKTPLRG